MTKPEGVSSMFPGAGCGQISVGGWVMMGLLWAAFLALVLWALSRLFASAPRDRGLPEKSDALGVRLAGGPVDPLSTEPCARNSPPDGVTDHSPSADERQPTQARIRSNVPD
jgi:hypothetical protein